MESLEVTGRTASEAIEKALALLGKTRDEVDISVLSEGSRGILGIGGEDARVLVSARAEIEEPKAPVIDPRVVGETARTILENILGGMQMDAVVDIVDLPTSAQTEGFVAALDISEADEIGTLIGRRGETLSALQFLTNLIVGKKLKKWSKVLVDVEGYRARRESSLRALAERVAARVQETGRPMPLEAMPPNERRIVHLALQNHTGIVTASQGEGDQRRVVVSPRT